MDNLLCTNSWDFKYILFLKQVWDSTNVVSDKSRLSVRGRAPIPPHPFLFPRGKLSCIVVVVVADLSHVCTIYYITEQMKYSAAVRNGRGKKPLGVLIVYSIVSEVHTGCVIMYDVFDWKFWFLMKNKLYQKHIDK